MSGRQSSLAYEFPANSLLPPAADAAGRTSAYYTLKNGLKSWILCSVNQGNAATVQFTVLQAQDVSGTGSKVLSTAIPIWLVENTATASYFVAQALGKNFTTDAATSNKLVLFEILAEEALDVANEFCTVAIQTGASNAANITSALLIINMSYKGANYPDPLFN
jgi:hypothetical protein